MRNKHKFTGLTGFVPDLAADTLPSDAVSGGENMRPTVKGYEKVYGYGDTDVDLGNEGTHIRYWLAGEGDSRWLVAGSTSIQGSQGGASTDMTRESKSYNPSGAYNWTSLDFNGVIIFNNATDSPQYLADDGRFHDFPELDSRIRFRVVRSFNAYLIGLGVDLGSGYDDNTVYWSHPADPGFMPATWDYADPASDAGITTLPSVGVVLDALPLVDVNIIYKSDVTYLQQFVGGSYIFTFNKLFTEHGILATGCVAAFGRQHFVVTQNDVIIHDGSTFESIATERTRRWLYNHMHNDFKARTFVVANPKTMEIFIYFASVNSSSGACDTALVWNWVTKGWHVQKLLSATHASWGESTVGFDAPVWNSETDNWDTSATRTWQGDLDVPEATVGLHLTSPDSDKFQAEKTPSDLAADSLVTGTWERENILLGALSRDGVIIPDYDSWKTVRAIHFHCQTDTPFEVFLGIKDDLDDETVWESYGMVDPIVTTRLDVLLTTGWLSIRLVSTKESFIIRGIAIDLDVTGEIY